MTPSCSTAYQSLLWIKVMKNISSGLLSKCCTVDMGALGWTAELEVLPSNLKPMLSPGWGSTRTWSFYPLNITQVSYWLQPRWLQGRAGTQESPCCEGGLTHKQKCFSGCPLPIPNPASTFLLHPLVTTQDSFRATQNKAVCLWDRITTRVEFQQFLLKNKAEI